MKATGLTCHELHGLVLPLLSISDTPVEFRQEGSRRDYKNSMRLLNASVGQANGPDVEAYARREAEIVEHCRLIYDIDHLPEEISVRQGSKLMHGVRSQRIKPCVPMSAQINLALGAHDLQRLDEAKMQKYWRQGKTHAFYVGAMDEECDLARFLSHYPEGLVSLELPQMFPEELDLAALGALLGKCTSLQHLAIDACSQVLASAIAPVSSQQLRMLTVSDGLATLDNCAALAKVIGNLALLRLDLGRDGGLCSAGAQVLVAAVCAHPTLKRLGLHRVADPDAAQELFTTLKHASQMQELAYSGPLKAEGFAALCGLMTGKPGLTALTLDGCALASEQMRELAHMVATNRLRELCISSQAFSDADAANLASAIGASTGLLSLGFRNCAISPEPQARALARGVAKSRSLLSLELHFGDDAVGDRASVARNFVLGAGRSDTLAHFDLQGTRCPGWAQAQEKLKQNRLR